MKVTCPKCSSKYKIDDHRVPAAGLKMKCPKCTTSFLVKKKNRTQVFGSQTSSDFELSDENVEEGSDVGTELDLPDFESIEPSSRIEIPDALAKAKEEKGTIAFGALSLGTNLGESDLPGLKDDLPPVLEQGEQEDDSFGEMDLPGMPDISGLPGLPMSLKPLPEKKNETIAFSPAGDQIGGRTDSPADDDSVDLPGMPSPAPGNSDFIDDELDFSKPPRPRTTPSDSASIDLPALSDGVDLPALSDAIDLPALSDGIDLPALSDAIDLPALNNTAADIPPLSEAIDLPPPTGEMDFPASTGTISFSGPANTLDLPGPAEAMDLSDPGDAIDLPSPGDALELLDSNPPYPNDAMDLSSTAGPLDEEGHPNTAATFGNIQVSSQIPAALRETGDSFSKDSLANNLPSPSSAPPGSPREALPGLPPSEFGGHRADGPPDSLPPLGSLAGGPLPSLDDGQQLPSIQPTRSTFATLSADTDVASRVSGSGNTDFGEVNLAPSTDQSDFQTGPELDVDNGEFDAFPTGRDTSEGSTRGTGLDLALDPDDLNHMSMGLGLGMDESSEEEGIQPGGDRKPGTSFIGRRKYERQSRRAKFFLLIALALLMIAGGALSLTEHGPFGAYAIARMLPTGAKTAINKQIKESLLRNLKLDRSATIDNSLKEIQAGEKNNSINEDLRLLGVFAYNWDQLRFGMDNQNNRLAAQLLGDINLPESESPYARLVIASQAALVRDVQKVEESLQGAIRETPEGLSILVAAYLDVGNGNKAVASATALTKTEESARANHLLARALILSGNYEKAITHLKAMESRFPNHLDTPLNYAEALVNLRPVNREKVIEIVAKIIDEANAIPSPRQKAQGHAIIARLLVMDRRYADAKKEIDKALALDPQNLFALIGRGEVAIKQGNSSGAAIAFKQALGKSPSNLEATLGQIETMILEGDLTAAKESILPLAAKHANNARIHYLLSQTHQALKEEEEAYNGYLKVIEMDKGFLEAYIALSEYYINTKQNQEAMKILDRASEEVPNSPLIHQALADAHAAGKDYASAIIELSKAIDLDPNDPLSHYKMGQMYRKMAMLEDAMRAFGEVETLDPSFPGLPMERGFLMELSGQTENALALYKQALAKSKDDPNLKTRVAAASHILGDQKTAETLLIDALAQKPDSAEINYYLGEVYRVTNRPGEAIRLLRNAAEIESKSALYRLRYGMVLKDVRKNSEAMEQLNLALELDPDMAETHLRIGQIQLQHGAAKSAIQTFEKTLALDPNMTETYEYIADAFDQVSDQRSAVAYYRKAAQARPNQAVIFFKMGLAELNAHGRRVALPSLTKAVKLGDVEGETPEWLPEALYHLGSTQNASGSKATAIKTFKRYLEIAPQNHIDRTEVLAILDQLGQ